MAITTDIIQSYIRSQDEDDDTDNDVSEQLVDDSSIEGTKTSEEVVLEEASATESLG